MRIRSILYMIFMVSIISFFLYSNKHHNESDADFNSNSIRKSTIQLAPFPVITSNSAELQDTILYDILINKLERTVLLYDAEVEVGKLKNLLPFSANHLMLEFKYNAERGRLEFVGSDLGATKIHGYILITNKNNIKYDVVVENSKFNLKIESIHNPNSEDSNMYVNGAFEISSKSGDLLNLVSLKLPFGNKPVIARGNFYMKGNEFKVDNIKIHDINLDLKMGLNFDEGKQPAFYLDAYYPSLEIQNLSQIINTNSLYLQDFLSSIDNRNFKVSMKIGDVLYKEKRFRNLEFDVKSKSSSEWYIDNISAEFGANSKFKSHGVLSTTKFHPSYSGSIKLENSKYKDLEKLFDLIPQKVKKTNKISISSDIVLNPSSLALKNLSLKEGRSVLRSDLLKYSTLENNRNILTGSVSMLNSAKDVDLVRALANKYQDTLGEDHLDYIDIHFLFPRDIEKKEEGTTSLDYVYDSNGVYINNLSFANNKIRGKAYIDNIQNQFVVEIKGHSIEVEQLHDVLDEVARMREAIPLSSELFPAHKFNATSLPGRIHINIDNINSNFQKLDCTLLYNKKVAHLSGCKARALGSEVLLSGKLGVNSKGLYYDVSYRGKGVGLHNVLNNIGANIVQSGNGNMDFQGYLESKGKDSEQLSKNMIGSIAVRFSDVKFNNMNEWISKTGKRILNSILPENVQQVGVHKANFEFNKSSITSKNIEYSSEGGDGNLKFEYNLASRLASMDVFPLHDQENKNAN